jgi:hypothetical protein
MNRKISKKDILKSLDHLIDSVSKFSVIIAVLFVIIQMNQNDRLERRRIAIEAVNKTRQIEFIRAFARLKTFYETKELDEKQNFVDDLNYVMSIFDNIAVLYLNGLVDQCVIKNAIEYNLDEVITIINSLENFPFEYRKNIDLLNKEMETKSCK